MNPYQVVEDFERALCEYTGAPYAVTVTSCTMALLLAAKLFAPTKVIVPSRTYVSVPMSMIHAGHRVGFEEQGWTGAYQLSPLPVWDSARWFTEDLFNQIAFHRVPFGEGLGAAESYDSAFVCVSFHATKVLALEQGGAILHNSSALHERLLRLRFDGRKQGVPPKYDRFPELGYHCYISPSVAAMGLLKLSVLPKFNAPLPNDDYPDLSKLAVFEDYK